MRVSLRIHRLEHRQRRVDVDLEERERNRSRDNLSLMLRFDPDTMAEFADLIIEEARLSKIGGFLTAAQCEEGRRLAAYCTARLREAQIAFGRTSDGMVYPFPYQPAPLKPEAQLCGQADKDHNDARSAP
jgi:hypothetical protein